MVTYFLTEQDGRPDFLIEIAKAKKLLETSDFKFTEDYDKKDTPEWLALKEERAKARLFLREYGY